MFEPSKIDTSVDDGSGSHSTMKRTAEPVMASDQTIQKHVLAIPSKPEAKFSVPVKIGVKFASQETTAFENVLISKFLKS